MLLICPIPVAESCPFLNTEPSLQCTHFCMRREGAVESQPAAAHTLVGPTFGVPVGIAAVKTLCPEAGLIITAIIIINANIGLLPNAQLCANLF